MSSDAGRPCSRPLTSTSEQQTGRSWKQTTPRPPKCESAANEFAQARP